MSNLFWVILASSLGTFAMRFLPMWGWHKYRIKTIPKVLEAGLAALGYAAIVALVVVSLWPQVAVTQPLIPMLRIIVAIFAIGVAHYLQKNVILSTVVGVLIFGLMQYFTINI